jgi:hypothetical protein
MVLAIAFFALVAEHGFHKLFTGAVIDKSGQSHGPFLAKTNDDSRTLQLYLSFSRKKKIQYIHHIHSFRCQLI